MPSNPDPGTVRPFADFLLELNNGGTHGEVSDALHNLIASATETGKKGAITLTISVEPAKGNSDLLMTSGTVATKFPRMEPRKSALYVTADGNLSVDNPKQLSFESLKVVAPAAPKEVRNA